MPRIDLHRNRIEIRFEFVEFREGKSALCDEPLLAKFDKVCWVYLVNLLQ